MPTPAIHVPCDLLYVVPLQLAVIRQVQLFARFVQHVIQRRRRGLYLLPIKRGIWWVDLEQSLKTPVGLPEALTWSLP